MSSQQRPFVLVNDGRRIEYQETEVRLRRPLPHNKRSASPHANPSVIKVRQPAIVDDNPQSTTSSTIEGDDVIVEFHNPRISRSNANSQKLSSGSSDEGMATSIASTSKYEVKVEPQRVQEQEARDEGVFYDAGGGLTETHTESHSYPDGSYSRKTATQHYTVQGDDDQVMLLQTAEQQNTLRRLLVIRQDGVVAVGEPSLSPTASGTRESSHGSRTTSPSTSYVSYNPDTEAKHSAVEYRNLNNDTIRRYYGHVTPYGTIARTELVDKSESNKNESGVNTTDGCAPVPQSVQASYTTPGSYSTLRSTTSPYGTIMRRENGGYSVSTAGADVEPVVPHLDYVDFIPKRLKRTQSFNENRNFETFSDCMNQANDWILENSQVNIKNCESLYQRLDHSHHVNSESTTSHDRSHVVGLRLWFSFINSTTSSEVGSCNNVTNDRKNCVRRLEYMNFIPRYKTEKIPNGKYRKPKDCPEFEDMKQTVQRFNNLNAQSPLPGKIISVEAIPINYAQAFCGDGNVNPDLGYWCLEFQGHWNVFILRIFYEKLDVKEDVEIGFEDFCPAPTKVTPSAPEFQEITSLNSNASRWLLSNSKYNLQILSCQMVEIPFRLKQLVANKGKINTKRTGYEPSKISSYWNTVRVLRVWYSYPRDGSGQPSTGTLKPPANNIPNVPVNLDMKCGLAVRTFSPCQVTTSSCCGARKPMFATTADTVNRINQWIEQTGAEVVAIQTDNIEKWNGKKCQLGKSLENRAYNRQDCPSSIATSSLDYRLTVFRVYVRADSLGKHGEPSKNAFPPCPPPVKPCCCFVGCTIM